MKKYYVKDVAVMVIFACILGLFMGMFSMSIHRRAFDKQVVKKIIRTSHGEKIKTMSIKFDAPHGQFDIGDTVVLIPKDDLDALRFGLMDINPMQ